MLGSKQLGLIGFGQFGRFAAPYLARHFEVLATDRVDIDAPARAVGARAVPFAEAAAAPIVVLAVPVQRLRDTLSDIRPHLQAGALVADVCSVKSLPLTWMLELLPDTVEVLGTHPMFGPNSAAAGLEGQRIVLCPGRSERIDSTCEALRSAGLQVIVTDADTHDRQAAYTQAVAQYLGRALDGLAGAEFEISTPAAELLRRVWRTVADDSFELFSAIQDLNPYAPAMRAEIHARLATLDHELAAANAADDAAPGSGEPS